MDYTYIEKATGGSRGGSWDEATTDSEEFLEKCGLNWTVETHPTHALVEGDDGVTREVACKGDVGHFRLNEDGSRIYLGTTGEGCSTFQNSEAMELLDAMCEEAGAEKLKGGCKDNGGKCWTQARMPDTFDAIMGDAVQLYLTMFWGHAGQGSILVGGTGNRMVCLNQQPMIMGNLKANSLLRVRHTRNMDQRISDGVKGLLAASAAFREFGEVAKRMASISINSERWTGLLDVVAPLPAEDKRQTNAWNIRAHLTDLFEGGLGTHIPGVRGTGWGAWQAVTEYTNHHRSTNGVGEVQRLNREHSVLFGSGNKLNVKAAQHVLSLA